MSLLQACAECGSSVSSQAEKCPKCGKDPRLYKCSMCERDGKTSDMINGVHRQCLDKYGDELNYHKCFACGKRFSYPPAVYPYVGWDKFPCPNCGQPYHIGICEICRRPAGQRYSAYNSGEYRQTLHSSPCAGIYADRGRKLEAEVQAKRRAAHECILCGGRLDRGLFGVLFGAEKCKACANRG